MLRVSPCKQGYHQSQEIYIQDKIPEEVNSIKQAVVFISDVRRYFRDRRELGSHDIVHGYPSWLYSVDQGATTIWEWWNAYTVEGGFHPTEAHNTSFNHYSYGSVVAWIFRGMAGISYDKNRPGFKHIILAPYPDRSLPAVNASYKSIYGTIVSNMRYKEDTWCYLATVPANTTAAIRLPVGDLDMLTVNGYPCCSEVSGLKFKPFDKDREIVAFEAGAGTYFFISRFS